MIDAIDVRSFGRHEFPMTEAPTYRWKLPSDETCVVGSVATRDSLAEMSVESIREACDLVEIRLDHAVKDRWRLDGSEWAHLSGVPLLFTPRCFAEGGVLQWSSAERMAVTDQILDDASLVDLEVASIDEMRPLIDRLAESKLSWVASFHDFQQLPERAVLEAKLNQAVAAGASAFKVAAQLNTFEDLTTLATFQQAPHAIHVATMGMGPLAAVSRILCAQAGSVLNYGFIGNTSTAPGQWSAAQLHKAIRSVPRL